jgi:hypothetical protein
MREGKEKMEGAGEETAIERVNKNRCREGLDT